MAEFVRIKMDLIHDRNRNILLSLHDSRIKKITFRNNVLILHLNKIFQYTKAGEKIYFGEITFTSGAGFDRFSSYSFDLEFGSSLTLLNRKEK